MLPPNCFWNVRLNSEARLSVFILEHWKQCEELQTIVQKKVLSLVNLLKRDHLLRLQVRKNSSIHLKSPLFRTMRKLTISWTWVKFQRRLNASLDFHWFSSASAQSMNNFTIDKIAQTFETSPRKQNPRWGFLCFMIPLHTEARHTRALFYFFSLSLFGAIIYTWSIW